MEGKHCVDKYEHQTLDVIYVDSSIPGPGIDLDEFESVFITGCTCNLECKENCTCTRGKQIYICEQLEESKEMILECNHNCKCNEKCGNRVVQQGPLDCLIVKETNKGLGLFTSKLIKKGQFICEYAGEIIGIEEASKRIDEIQVNNLMNYVLVVSEFIGEKKITTCIDPARFGNIGRYANHSCQPNAFLVPVRIENMVPKLCLFASKNIDAMDEITFNYGGKIDNSQITLSSTRCLCGSEVCMKFLPHSKHDF